MTPKDTEYMSELLANSTWLNGTADCFEETLAKKLANAERKDNISVSKITASEMSDVLKLYTWITLEGTHKVGLDKFVYLEEHDAYCLVVPNERPIYRLCVILAGYRTENGQVILLCTKTI